MKKESHMIYKYLLEKRLMRKRAELSDIERSMNMGCDLMSGYERRRYIELKAAIRELEDCCDIVEVSILKN